MPLKYFRNFLPVISKKSVFLPLEKIKRKYNN
jgi:hypothetical protein